MSVAVSSQSSIPSSADVKYVSPPSPSQTNYTVSALIEDNTSPTSVTAVDISQSTENGNAAISASGQKRKNSDVMKFPHDDLDCNLTTEDLVAIAKTAVTLPPLPVSKEEALTNPIEIQPCPAPKKTCLQHNLQTAQLQPYQSIPLAPREVPTPFSLPSTQQTIFSSSLHKNLTPITPGVMRVTPRNSFTQGPVIVATNTSTKATLASSAKRRGRGVTTKPQMRYDPKVPMSKQEAAAWRREQRRVRNRESAALSRQKTRDRIVELETELKAWQKKYVDAMSRVHMLEQQQTVSGGVGVNSAVTTQEQSGINRGIISPSDSPSASPVPFTCAVPQMVPSLGSVPLKTAGPCIVPLVSNSHSQNSPPLLPLPQFYRSQGSQKETVAVVPQQQSVPTSQEFEQKNVNLQQLKPEGQHSNENNLRPAVKIDCVDQKVDAVAGSSLSAKSDWNGNQVSKEILPDSCCSSSVVSNGANTTASNIANVSEPSDDDTAVASVSKDDETSKTEAAAATSGLNLLEDGGNVLDDILFDALKGIDGFNGNTSYAL